MVVNDLNMIGKGFLLHGSGASRNLVAAPWALGRYMAPKLHIGEHESLACVALIPGSMDAGPSARWTPENGYLTAR